MTDRFKQHGAFSWFELMTTDLDAAKRFYARLFNWQLQDMPMGQGTYTVVNVGKEGAGGMMAMPPESEGAPPGWGVYVTVDDVDQTVRQAEELGAKTIVPPRNIPEVGRFAVFQDPQGAVISVITYSMSEQ